MCAKILGGIIIIIINYALEVNHEKDLSEKIFDLSFKDWEKDEFFMSDKSVYKAVIWPRYTIYMNKKYAAYAKHDIISYGKEQLF